MKKNAKKSEQRRKRKKESNQAAGRGLNRKKEAVRKNFISKGFPPDFEMANVDKLDPRDVVDPANEGRSQVFLVLALAFNDLKGIAYAGFQLAKFEPPVDISGPYGNLVGMRLQIWRMAAGTVNELIEYIFSKKTFFLSQPFKAVVQRCPAQVQQHWQDLIAIALDNKHSNSGTFRRELHDIRNKGSFHYDGDALLKGYKAHFFTESDDEHRKHAMFANGTTWEKTRFFYADAAVHRTLNAQVSDGAWVRLEKLVNSLNFALRGALVSFIDLRVNP